MVSITKRKWLKGFALLFFITFTVTQIYCLARAPLPRDEYSDYIVRNLQVEDLPNDDGSGLLLSWEPLEAEARIIEYRVYRGSTEDKLFLIGTIPVNPKTGFAGDRVYYYDTGYNLMTTVNSPKKLRKEVQQSEDSPIYQEIPRDLTVTKNKFENYSILGSIPKKNYYYKAELIELDEEEGFYAGLKDRQFQQILSRLKADTPYYYSIIAVNEQRRYYPYAPIASGIPRINSPERPRSLYPVLVEDIGRIQFEWTLPIVSDGVGRVNVYLLAKRDINLFNEYIEELNKFEENRLQRLDNPDMEAYSITQGNPAKLLKALPFSAMNTSFTDLTDGKIKDVNGNTILDIDSEDLNQYYAVHSFANYWGLETFGSPFDFNIIEQEMLPAAPQFTVIDKPNDQGDYNLIYWDKPVVFLTNSNFLNSERTKLLINYEFETNELYEIQNIYFDVYDYEGELITQVNEFYQDLFFKITIPDKYDMNSPEYDITRPIKFEITLRVSGNELPDDYVLKQDLVYNLDYMAYRPTPLYLRSDKVADYTYNIYKKPYSGQSFRLSSRAAGILRQVDDNIRYKTNIFKPIQKILPEQQTLLVDTNINAFYDKENERSVNTHIFYELVERDIREYQSEINRISAELESAGPEEIPQLQAALDRYKMLLDYQEHEFMQEANSQRNNRERMKMISERREREMRLFQYKMVKSNSKGHFVETDVYKDEDGNTYFYPLPNWFNTERTATLFASLFWGFLVFFMIKRAKQGKDMYIRPIAGLEEIDNAIGRATEMGRPILFNPGLDGIGAVSTLAGLAILGRVAKKAAEYDTRILVPCRDVITMPIAQEIVKEAHYEAGRPDTYDKNSVFFITSQQFAFVAGVNGVMVREKCATCFYMGAYYAEALIMTEVGNTIGAVQIAGTDAVTQVPFFITTCDYTLIGEELYGASAYLAREPMMMGTLKATDVAKFIIIVCIITGTFLSTIQQTFFINIFPDK